MKVFRTQLLYRGKIDAVAPLSRIASIAVQAAGSMVSDWSWLVATCAGCHNDDESDTSSLKLHFLVEVAAAVTAETCCTVWRMRATWVNCSAVRGIPDNG